MILLIGLGNHGSEYARHRHNVGFMALEAIAQSLSAPPFVKKYKGLWAEARQGGHKIGLLMPHTYMNLSGQSAQQVVNFFKIPPENIFVFHDELDLPTGKVRMKRGGGAAGHNGLRSLDECLGTPDYWRVRIGIGHPGDKDRVTGYVLGNFSADDQIWLEPTLKAISKHIGLLTSGRDNDFMTKIAAETKKDKKDGI